MPHTFKNDKERRDYQKSMAPEWVGLEEGDVDIAALFNVTKEQALAHAFGHMRLQVNGFNKEEALSYGIKKAKEELTKL